MRVRDRRGGESRGERLVEFARQRRARGARQDARDHVAHEGCDLDHRRRRRRRRDGPSAARAAPRWPASRVRALPRLRSVATSMRSSSDAMASKSRPHDEVGGLATPRAAIARTERSSRGSRRACQGSVRGSRRERAREPHRGHPPGFPRRCVAARQRHGLEMREPLAAIERHAQQLATPERAVGTEPHAVERERERGPAASVLDQAGGGVRVVVLDGEHARSEPRGELRADRVGVEIVDRHGGYDAEEAAQIERRGGRAHRPRWPTRDRRRARRARSRRRRSPPAPPSDHRRPRRSVRARKHRPAGAARAVCCRARAGSGSGHPLRCDGPDRRSAGRRHGRGRGTGRPPSPVRGARPLRSGASARRCGSRS